APETPTGGWGSQVGLVGSTIPCMSRSMFFAPVTVLILLTGCASAAPPAGVVEPSGPSAACQAAVDELAALPMNDPGEDGAITKSVTACATVDEYLEAVKVTPSAWLKESPEEVGEGAKWIILAACSKNEGAPV